MKRQTQRFVCIPYQLMQCPCENGNIVVRASDTDIAVILLYYCHRFKSTLWMDIGTVSKNRRYVSLTAIWKELGPDLYAALPAFHAFTGSDYRADQNHIK